MRVIKLCLTLFALLTTAVLAWEKEDHEIFDLVYEIENSEGKGTTFYSWLDVPSTATTGEIAKAYRKKSMVLHPDKNPGLKGAHERFARLGVVSKILREPESRKRYDFFYKNGVPKWRGTGYYYARFRPGLGSVLVFLTILTSTLQYVVQRMNYKRDLARIDQIVNRAKAAAWGPKMIPVTGQRKVRVNLGEARDDEGYPIGERAVNMVVDGDFVYLVEDDGSLTPIDRSTAVPPAILRTWFFNLLKTLFSKVTGRKPSSPNELDEDHFDDDKSGQAPDNDSDNGEDDASSTTASVSHRSGTSTPNGKGVGVNAGLLPAAAAKAGGARRKNVRKRK